MKRLAGLSGLMFGFASLVIVSACSSNPSSMTASNKSNSAKASTKGLEFALDLPSLPDVPVTEASFAQLTIVEGDARFGIPACAERRTVLLFKPPTPTLPPKIEPEPQMGVLSSLPGGAGLTTNESSEDVAPISSSQVVFDGNFEFVPGTKLGPVELVSGNYSANLSIHVNGILTYLGAAHFSVAAGKVSEVNLELTKIEPCPPPKGAVVINPVIPDPNGFVNACELFKFPPPEVSVKGPVGCTWASEEKKVLRSFSRYQDADGKVMIAKQACAANLRVKKSFYQDVMCKSIPPGLLSSPIGRQLFEKMFGPEQ